MSLAEEFRAAIAAADATLSMVSAEKAEQRIREGGWSRKEVLGHLIDSAAHNHIRFVTASNSESLQFDSYDQKRCVQLHGYGELEWPELLAHWRAQNKLIIRVVDRIPESNYGVPCIVPDGSRWSLEDLIRDYLRHLDHHVRQVT